jgi:glycerol uptake facilitator-like aquaporin
MGGKLKADNTPINGELEKMGGFGRYQWFVVISMILGQLSGGFIAHGIAYLELPPHYPGYLCTTTGSSEEVVCAPKY